MPEADYRRLSHVCVCVCVCVCVFLTLRISISRCLRASLSLPLSVRVRVLVGMNIFVSPSSLSFMLPVLGTPFALFRVHGDDPFLEFTMTISKTY